jgi:Putative polyhydroxyalkanoic acid system protein (PHA_gran_rgn)
MSGASEPIVINIPHRLGRDEAKRRIARGLGAIRDEIARHVRSIDYSWDGYRLDFRVVVLLQTIAGHLDVSDEVVRVEFALPRLLHLVAKTIAGRIERRGTALLEGPINR